MKKSKVVLEGSDNDSNLNPSEMLKKKINTSKPINVYLISFLLSAALKDRKLCEVIIIIMYFGICNISRWDMHKIIPQREGKWIELYRHSVYISYWS